MPSPTLLIRRAVDKAEQADRNLLAVVLDAQADGTPLAVIADVLGIKGGRQGAHQWIETRAKRWPDLAEQYEAV